jgi:hypothetical protein
MQHFSADAETDLFHSSVHPSIQQPTLPVLPRLTPCTYRHQQTPPRQELYISIGSFLFFGEKSTAITKESELLGVKSLCTHREQPAGAKIYSVAGLHGCFNSFCVIQRRNQIRIKSFSTVGVLYMYNTERDNAVGGEPRGKWRPGYYMCRC